MRTGESAPDIEGSGPDMQVKRPDTEVSAPDAALPARLLGPTGDVEAAVQRGMATVRRLLDDPDYARLAQKREAAEARVEELEAERARLRAALEPLAAAGAFIDSGEFIDPAEVPDHDILCYWGDDPDTSPDNVRRTRGPYVQITVGQARAARAALAGEGRDG